MSEKYYNFIKIKYIMLSTFNLEKYNSTKKCIECKNNPVFNTFHNMCIFCLNPRCDYNEKCYSCDDCVETRKYLSATDNMFKLVYHNSCHGDLTEVWKCTICTYCTEIRAIVPGIHRDLLHELMRKEHQEKCKKLQNCEIILE